MLRIGTAPGVTVHTVTAACDRCGAVLPDIPIPLAEQWLTAHRAPALLTVDMTIDGQRSTWRRRG